MVAYSADPGGPGLLPYRAYPGRDGRIGLLADAVAVDTMSDGYVDPDPVGDRASPGAAR